MTKTFSPSAQALMMSLLTGQAVHWQRAWATQPFAAQAWRTVSTMMFSKILEPVWWCCRCPDPVVTVRKNTVYWLAYLVQEPGPASEKLWVDAVKARYQMQTNSALGHDADAFLLQVFQDYVVLYDLYRKGKDQTSNG
ncbi:hypothetical protein [Rahnella sp. PCH160]|uniref:hypothetical protein n=1 Tax=Rahnella sp. PCH160 TaxID=3447928 RepID=UPI0039FBC467